MQNNIHQSWKPLFDKFNINLEELEKDDKLSIGVLTIVVAVAEIFLFLYYYHYIPIFIILYFFIKKVI